MPRKIYTLQFFYVPYEQNFVTEKQCFTFVWNNNAKTVFLVCLCNTVNWLQFTRDTRHAPIMYQSIPKPPIPPRAIPGHLTRVKLRTVGNLTQNEARPVGHLTFVSKRLSAVGSRRISQFFDSAGEPRSRVIVLVDFAWVFLLLSFYMVPSWNMPLLKVWSEDKLNKKFVVAENFAELVSTVCFTWLVGGGFDPLWSSNGWGIWPSKLAT